MMLVPAMLAAAVLGLVAAVAAVGLLAGGVARPGADAPGLSVPALTLASGPALVTALLGLILLVLMGMFVLLLILVLCVCCCGCGKDSGGLLRLLGLLLPALPAGLRAGARGFDVAADVTHAAIDPLHTTGAALRDTLGPAVQTIPVPSVRLPVRTLWDALHDARLVHGAKPDWFPNLWVLNGVDLGTTNPFDGPGALGTRLTDAGRDLDAASTRSRTLETDLRTAGAGLRSVASALDGQP